MNLLRGMASRFWRWLTVPDPASASWTWRELGWLTLRCLLALLLAPAVATAIMSMLILLTPVADEVNRTAVIQLFSGWMFATLSVGGPGALALWGVGFVHARNFLFAGGLIAGTLIFFLFAGNFPLNRLAVIVAIFALAGAACGWMIWRIIFAGRIGVADPENDQTAQ